MGQRIYRPRPCRSCGTDFTPSGPSGVFCSRRCRYGVGTCEACGAEFVRWSDSTAQRARQRFCSRRCKCEHSRHEQIVQADGYVLVRAGTMRRSPNGDGYVRIHVGGASRRADGRILEHRWVMEQVLGRELMPGENVHHRNGDRADNRPENLELWVIKQPQGQRVTDAVEWAREILRRYCPDDLARG